MRGDPDPDGSLTASEGIGARLSDALHRAWAKEKTRRRMVISAVAIVIVVGIAVVASLFASLAGQSQSYKDGYAAGGAAYTAYGDSSLTAKQACRDEETGPGGRPVHDDPSQWVQGCADAFDLAQSDN